MPDGRGLIPLDEVFRRLGLKGQSYAGIRAIQIERIIGTAEGAEGVLLRTLPLDDKRK